MFSDKKNKNKKHAVDPLSSENRINEGTVFIGDIQSSGFFRIDGTVEGNITSPARIVVGKNGVIKGKLHCDNADIEGKIKGEVKVNEMLILRTTAVVEGEIHTSQLEIESGAIFNANCTMKDNIKVLQEEHGNQKTKKNKRA